LKENNGSVTKSNKAFFIVNIYTSGNFIVTLGTKVRLGGI